MTRVMSSENPLLPDISERVNKRIYWHWKLHGCGFISTIRITWPSCCYLWSCSFDVWNDDYFILFVYFLVFVICFLIVCNSVIFMIPILNTSLTSTSLFVIHFRICADSHVACSWAGFLTLTCFCLRPPIQIRTCCRPGPDQAGTERSDWLWHVATSRNSEYVNSSENS